MVATGELDKFAGSEFGHRHWRWAVRLMRREAHRNPERKVGGVNKT